MCGVPFAAPVLLPEAAFWPEPAPLATVPGLHRCRSGDPLGACPECNRRPFPWSSESSWPGGRQQLLPSDCDRRGIGSETGRRLREDSTVMSIAESLLPIQPYEQRSARLCWESKRRRLSFEGSLAEILTSSTLCSRLGGVTDAPFLVPSRHLRLRQYDPAFWSVSSDTQRTTVGTGTSCSNVTFGGTSGWIRI